MSLGFLGRISVNSASVPAATRKATERKNEYRYVILRHRELPVIIAPLGSVVNKKRYYTASRAPIQ